VDSNLFEEVIVCCSHAFKYWAEMFCLQYSYFNL